MTDTPDGNGQTPPPSPGTELIAILVTIVVVIIAVLVALQFPELFAWFFDAKSPMP